MIEEQLKKYWRVWNRFFNHIEATHSLIYIYKKTCNTEGTSPLLTLCGLVGFPAVLGPLILAGLRRNRTRPITIHAIIIIGIVKSPSLEGFGPGTAKQNNDDSCMYYFTFIVYYLFLQAANTSVRHARGVLLSFPLINHIALYGIMSLWVLVLPELCGYVQRHGKCQN